VYGVVVAGGHSGLEVEEDGATGVLEGWAQGSRHVP
jgi:hypothetical protein